MDPGAVLAQKFFIPFFERRWGVHGPELLRALEESQYDSAEELLDQQMQQFRSLTAHAIESVPFYREHLHGVDVEHIRSPEDIARLPVLTKQHLREHSERLIADGFTRDTMFHRRTGGSTGVPVHVWWDHPMHVFSRAMTKRHDAWAGFELGQRRAALWGDTEKKYPWRERVFQALCDRTIYLDTLLMDEAHLEAFVGQARRFRPEILMGHAHSIFFLTRYLVEQGHDDLHFRGIISTAETLTPVEREFVEARFGPVVFDRYGCEEVSLIASECAAHDGLHTSAEGMLVEVDGGDETTPGPVIVTNLICRGMPMIRYEVGDLATRRDGLCACGRGLPRLGRVFGRTTDFLYAPDGRQVSGVSILDTFVIHVPGLRQAQIVQDRLDHLRLRIVRDTGFTDDSARQLGVTVREVFGAGMQHDIEYVEEIEPTPRGKYQFSVCEIDPPGTGG